MEDLGYPLMDENYTLTSELKSFREAQELEKDKPRLDLVKTQLTPVKRILGFVKLAHPDDVHGWECLTDVARIKQYIQIMIKWWCAAEYAKNLHRLSPERVQNSDRTFLFQVWLGGRPTGGMYHF